VLIRSSASLVSMLYGVQENLEIANMSYGWSLCYNDTYDVVLNTTLLNTILHDCNKTRILLGCRLINATVLSLAAMGYRQDVLFDCGNGTTCRNVANGVSWYYSDSYSWGFAAGSSTVNRVSCDTGE
jgi:hypothetical protein